jgi:iron complex outermembrane receptor protein
MRAFLLATAAFSTLATGTAAQAAEAEGELKEIVVTAQRRSENLQRAAIPVSAISGDALLNAGISDTANLSKLVPALQIQPAGGSTLNIYIRGVGTLQGNSFGENPIAYNFNGVYLARPTAPVGSLYDLERIEVVKGPQGTLYGRNATGGAINVLPKAPVLGELGGDVTLEYGNFNNKRGNAAINVPLGDKAALRIAGQIVNRDGFLSDGYSDEVGEAVRASLKFEASPQLSVTLVGDYFHLGGKGVGSVLVPGTATPAGFPVVSAPPIDSLIGGSDSRSTAALQAFTAGLFAPPFCGGPGGFVTSGCVQPPRGDGFNDSKFYGLSATIDADLGFARLTVIPAWRQSKPRFLTYMPGFRGEIAETSDQTSVEVRLSGPDDAAFSYVVGGFWFSERQTATNFFVQGNLSTTRFTPDLDTDSLAVFGQARLRLADTVRLVAGARYTDETRRQSTSFAAGGLPGPVFPALGVPATGRLQFDKITWKAGVEWDAGPRSLVYANVSTGFKAGGFFVSLPPNNSFRPEELTAYTIGSKNRFLDNRLQLNIEAFYWDYKDQQISFVGGIPTPTGIGSGLVTINAGQARMYGADVELQYSVTPNGTFSANVQFLDGRYDSLVFTALSVSGAPVRTGCTITGSRAANPGTPSPARFYDLNCSGRATVNSPRWTAVLGYDHRIDLSGGLGLVLSVRSRIESRRDRTIDYLPETAQSGFTNSDLLATLEGKEQRWSVTGYVSNIENNIVKAGATLRPVLNTVYAPLRLPRTYGIRGTVRF